MLSSEDLERLKDMTSKLPPVPKLEQFKKAHKETEDLSCVTYEASSDSGTIISCSLMSTPEISVARTFVSAGGKFPVHKHTEKEVLVLYSGRGVIYKGEERIFMNAGDCVIIEPDEHHTARALEDSWLIAIAIPRSEDFPE